ncbi:alginate export family protein [Marinobacterium lutimaris]|uniref:Alginate production protein n=1 Tax=Marinobacterium lutimaris TaxID=568106 RepID=A0A1H6CVP5_9GAMM|nr:alginate export family protein [Marinobacterium lutimaris]SEG77159.1 alginate production protein [Marinobacterium lutimaris]
MRKTRLCVVVAGLMGLSAHQLSLAEEGVESSAGQFAAEEIETFEVNHKFTMETASGPEDARLGADRDQSYSLRYEPTLIWYSPEKRWPKWRTLVRGWIAYDSGSAVSSLQDERREQAEGWNAELREFYVTRNLIGDDPRFSLSFGRQRYSDYLGLWWDDTFESVRFSYQDDTARGFVAAGQKFYNYNSDVNRLDPSEEDIALLMGEYGRSWRIGHWAGIRLMYEDDHSGADLDDPDDFTGFRYGVFAQGEYASGSRLNDYHLELAAVTGDRDEVAQAGSRTVDINGWAAIGEVGTQMIDWRWSPRFSFRAGITDKPDEDQDGFYLNSIQSDRQVTDDNFSTRLVSSFMGLQVSNLAYYGVGVEFSPTERSGVNMRLSDLYLRNPDADMPIRSVVPQDPDSRSLGQVFDVSYSWQRFPEAYKGRLLSVDTLLSAGYFFAGPATGDLDDEYQLTLGVVVRYR